MDKIAIESNYVNCGAESMPLDSYEYDTVVMTYTLCTIADLKSTFAEIRRVLKRSGRVLFIEHGLSPDPSIQKIQNRVNPLWKRIAGGCHLNRDILSLLETGGFKYSGVNTMYLPGWKPATYNIWGAAQVS